MLFRSEAVYANWVVRLLELGLTAAVLYHAINGVKIMVYDFWSKGSRYYKPISIASHALFALSMVPVSWIMLNQAWNLFTGATA